jgi:hypothetical protein
MGVRETMGVSMSMAGQDRLYAVATPNVVSEVFDSEVVVINLTTGVYYSLTGSAPAFWTALCLPISEAELDRAVAERCVADLDTVRAARVGLVEVLLAEGLISVVTADAVPPATASPMASSSGPFVAPVINRFDDLQERIKLDPVHDIAARVVTRDGGP